LLEDCPALGDFSALTQLPSLGVINLRGIPRLRDLSPFAGVSGLDYMSIRDCDNLVTLEGLERKDRLDDLWVSRCRGLRAPGRLGELPALRAVRIQDCPSLTGLD
ncbi:hypothetical protein, partial [Escherichia coli]